LCRTTAYGALAPIPDDVDLLVAGFSCVDFSGLNNKKKAITAGGESGDTFSAIMAYADIYRPKIIILENVKHAPWVAIRGQRMAEIGYAAEFLITDTKNYYLPQTRQRGYMICVDARLRGKAEIASILAEWKEALQSLARPASCPVESFLLDDDDDRVILARDELTNPSRGDQKRRKDVDWSRCQARHQDYRAALFLGQKRPVTKWEEGGSCKAPDYAWTDWVRGQVERVLDTIDIAWLRNMNRGFDSLYKL
jgi:site-specific DNA-cytosine methylase